MAGASIGKRVQNSSGPTRRPLRDILLVLALPRCVLFRGRHFAQAREAISQVKREPVLFDFADMDVHVPQSGNNELPRARNNPRTRGNDASMPLGRMPLSVPR